jgi:hypothetical protein
MIHVDPEIQSAVKEDTKILDTSSSWNEQMPNEVVLQISVAPPCEGYNLAFRGVQLQSI